jgi:PAS domain S-box-containing protein
VSINTTLITNAEGIVIGAQGLVTDISDRKQAEQEILENQRLIQQIADSSPNVLYLYDLQEQRNTYANREILATLGYSATEVQEMGASWLPTVIHPDDLVPTLEHFERLKTAKDSEVFSNEYRFRHANGEWRYFYSRDLIFSRDTEGQVKLIIGTAQDITDRKVAEAALRASEQRWQFALESAGDGVWDWNIQENQLFFSRQWKAMLGYADEEIENRFESWENLVHPDDLSQCHKDINKCLNQETLFYENEHQLRCKDGSYKWILARGKVIEWSADGHALRMMGTHTDLSDRKLAEVQLQQKNIELQQKNIELQQLVQLREEALTLREDMSNMIVHDLRNPLSGILLSAEIIKKYGDRPDQQALMAKKAEQILKSGNRLKAMIDSLLLMAKLESGKILFNPVPTDLHELGTAIVSDFELTAQSQRIELKGELPSPGNSIIIDAVILRRVIENLISNALKFSPPNSQVWLQIEYLPENHLRVKVIDNGPGVSPDRAEEIFKKFEIGTVKQNVSQIGLGLAFCKMAVEAQGGTLAIAPNQPQGSIFTVEI